MNKAGIRNILAIMLWVSVWSAAVAAEGDSYSWPAYNPTISYNFKDENPNFTLPGKDLDDCSGIAGRKSSGWWTFVWGSKKNSLVTDTAISLLLDRMNKDFAYFRDAMGWPPDKRARNGYRSSIYLYGSGLCTDNASNTEKGGWQSAIGSYPMVLLSYYPVYSFDPSCKYGDRIDQQGACVHEGIHSVLADLPGCKKAAWFQEGGNTWLQQQATAQQTNVYDNMGFLNGTSFIAPFMPIECYSGWLQDGSFGGPSAEGVNKFEGGTQICTWRTFLGGVQYSNAFPTFLGEWLGLGSIPWIWKNCPGRVLEGIVAGLGEEQTRRLIMEYRAKQALLDMKKWSNAFKKLLNDNFGRSLGPEWEPSWIKCDAWTATPYVKTTTDGSGLLVPEERTLPGWSGANQIPLKVNGTVVSVDFQPIGANMTLQLCYRAKDGTPVYSTPVSSGTCNLKLTLPPVNDVVIAVVCNTDYIYKSDETRKAKFDYRLKPGTGIAGTAAINQKWYNVTLPATGVAPEATSRNMRKTGRRICFDGYRLTFSGAQLPAERIVSVCLYTPAGRLVSTYQPENDLSLQNGIIVDGLLSTQRDATGIRLVRVTTTAGHFSGIIRLVR